jgi:hypothetical protein
MRFKVRRAFALLAALALAGCAVWHEPTTAAGRRGECLRACASRGSQCRAQPTNALACNAVQSQCEARCRDAP